MRQRDHFGLVCGARGEQDECVVDPRARLPRPGRVAAHPRRFRGCRRDPAGGDVYPEFPCRNGELRRWRGIDRKWADEDRLRPQPFEPGGHLRLGQCGIQRSDHQPGTCRPEERDDELGIVGTDKANRVPSAQPCAAQAGGHVVDQGGEVAIGQVYPVPGYDKRPPFRTVAHLLIEEIEQSCDRRRHIHVRAANDSLSENGHAHLKNAHT